jgi:hypothetical protein
MCLTGYVESVQKDYSAYVALAVFLIDRRICK